MNAARLPRRVAMISVHTSPLEQPGSGDVGGLNVYLLELSRRLARRGIDVEIFTRATARTQPTTVEAEPGVLVHRVEAGPYENLAKTDLPARLCDFAHEMLRTEAGRDPGAYDLVHGHYWLSGQVGLTVAERWGVPLVQTMHTMAKVKNSLLAKGDRPEPRSRILGEEQVVAGADRLVANAADEARALIEAYDADPAKVTIVHPGVDLATFTPGDRSAARERLGLDRDAIVLAFAGRLQPLKAPDVLLRAVARILRRRPAWRDRLVVAVIGGPSGEPARGVRGVRGRLARGSSLAGLAKRLDIAEVVRFVDPLPQPELAGWFRAATAVAVPSYNESFGLVALEAQACGTPVVAAATGGLPTAVLDDDSGVLVHGHEPWLWARTLVRLIEDPERLARLGSGARRQAARFDWSVTADRMLGVYADVLSDRATASAAGCRA